MKLKTLFRNLIPLKKMQAKTKLDHFKDGIKQKEREKITVKNDFVLNRATDEVIFFCDRIEKENENNAKTECMKAKLLNHAFDESVNIIS